MQCCERRHVESMHRRIGFVGHPEQCKRGIQGDLHAPAPGDDRPDSLKNRILHSKHGRVANVGDLGGSED